MRIEPYYSHLILNKNIYETGNSYLNLVFFLESLFTSILSNL